jgi:hypothetical protein
MVELQSSLCVCVLFYICIFDYRLLFSKETLVHERFSTRWVLFILLLPLHMMYVKSNVPNIV